MSFLKHLFGREDSNLPQASRLMMPGSSLPWQDQKAAAADVAHMRRELLRSVLHKTLARHGIPAAWLGAEMLVATSRGREAGMHWRLLVKHWDARLLTHAVALQNSLVTRLLGADPLAADWLTGISWQFDLPDDASCPAMPQPGYWTAEPRRAASPAAAVSRDAGVIAGPVRIAPSAAPKSASAHDDAADTPDSVRLDLDRLLAVRDAELARHEQEHAAGQLTEPMYLATEPQPLAASRRSLG